MLIKTYFDQKVPWNFLQSSMELFEQHFHGIPYNLSNTTSSSMEFHGMMSRSKVPWNSMELFPYSEFHGIPWNSMEFLIIPKKVPWNSMELDKFDILKRLYFLVLFLVFDWWSYAIWQKFVFWTPRCQRKWRKVSENGVLFYPFSNLNSYTVEVWEWISNFIPYFNQICDYLSMLGLKLKHVSKEGCRA